MRLQRSGRTSRSAGAIGGGGGGSANPTAPPVLLGTTSYATTLTTSTFSPAAIPSIGAGDTVIFAAMSETDALQNLNTPAVFADGTILEEIAVTDAIPSKFITGYFEWDGVSSVNLVPGFSGVHADNITTLVMFGASDCGTPESEGVGYMRDNSVDALRTHDPILYGDAASKWQSNAGIKRSTASPEAEHEGDANWALLMLYGNGDDGSALNQTAWSQTGNWPWVGSSSTSGTDTKCAGMGRVGPSNAVTAAEGFLDSTDLGTYMSIASLVSVPGL